MTRDVVFKEEIFPFLISDENKEGKKRDLGSFNCEIEEIISNQEDDEPLNYEQPEKREQQEEALEQEIFWENSDLLDEGIQDDKGKY